MRKNIFLIIIFITILLLPLFDSIFKVSPVEDLFEKRILAKNPKNPTNLKELLNFPKKYENYFNDNYGFRKSFILLNDKMMDKLFNESPDSRAITGKENWLYFDNLNSLLDAIGRAKLDQELIDKGVESFADNWKKLKKRNIEYLVVIAGDKSTIYPEYLPGYLKPKGPHRIDLFIEALIKKYPNFPIIDLRPILLDAKSKEDVPLYHKTDTHWNLRGSYIGYEAIMKKLNIKHFLRSDFIEKNDSFFRGDISEMMHSKAKNINHQLVPKFKLQSQSISWRQSKDNSFHNFVKSKNKNVNLPRIFAFKDSFFANLRALISEHFSYGFYANEFHCNIDMKVVDEYKPDVFIQQFWEGRIEQVLKKCN